METARPGDRVVVDFTARTEGKVFDSSKKRKPLEFRIGSGRMIPGFEQAVTGMCPGDSKTVIVPCDMAYGPRRDDLVLHIKREFFPADMNLRPGQRLQLTLRDQKKIEVTLRTVTRQHVEVDANHPMAGKDLELDIELRRIV